MNYGLISFWLDAEVLSVVQQIIDAFPHLSSINYTIHMNHALLMKAILLYCGVTEEQHTDVLAALSDNRVCWVML